MKDLAPDIVRQRLLCKNFDSTAAVDFTREYFRASAIEHRGF
jgi:hypothetical protein